MSARIQPLAAVRFTPAAGRLSDLVCPPYDNISADLKRALWDKSPHNAVRLVLSAEGDPLDWHAAAARRWVDWRGAGLLAADAEPGIYLYEIEYEVDGKTLARRGFMARQRLPETDSTDVRPHERTFEGPKADRLKLFRASRAILSPVFLLYRDPREETLPLLSSAAWDAEAQDIFGYRHRIRRVVDPAVIATLSDALARSDVMIADGHHRFATAQNLRDQMRAEHGDDPDAPWNFTLTYFVPVEDPGLSILPTHRLLKLKPDDDLPWMLSQMEKLFDVRQVESLSAPGSKGEIGVATREGNYRLTLLPGASLKDLLPLETSESYEKLDVVLLHAGLLGECLGIAPEEYAERITYVRGAEAAEAMVVSGKADVAFLLHPTSVEEVLAVAGTGERMPQKSTDFYPKALTGLLFYPFE